MRPDRQRFLNKLNTVRAQLRRVARIDSDDPTTSTLSLVCQDGQKRAPRSVQNALCQIRAHHASQVQVLDDQCAIPIRILLCGLEMKVAALARNFQVCLRRATRHLRAAMAALLAGTQAALLALQGRLTRPKEAWVLDHPTITIGQKDLQADINADCTPRVISRRQVGCGRQCTDDERVPMPIGPLDQVASPGCAVHCSMPLDLDRCAELGWNTQHASVKPYVLAFSELTQVDAVPLIAAPEAWKAPASVLVLQEVCQRFGQAIGQALHRGCGNVCATTTGKPLVQLVAIQERAGFGEVLLLARKHLIVDVARLEQAGREAAALLSVGVQAKLIRSHVPNYI